MTVYDPLQNCLWRTPLNQPPSSTTYILHYDALLSRACLFFQELVKFAKYILSKFFELLPKNPMLFVELVVWKSAGNCYEIMEGYGSLAVR